MAAEAIWFASVRVPGMGEALVGASGSRASESEALGASGM
jgi:hypothetical protein